MGGTCTGDSLQAIVKTVPQASSPFLCLSAQGKVCEWVVALSSSSVCSGVSRSQEVIEFPLLKISISTPAGNPPEMKWTADVYVSIMVGG